MQVYLVREKALEFSVTETRYDSPRPRISRDGKVNFSITADNVVPWNDNVPTPIYNKVKQHLESRNEVSIRASFTELGFVEFNRQMSVILQSNVFEHFPVILGAGVKLKILASNMQVLKKGAKPDDAVKGCRASTKDVFLRTGSIFCCTMDMPKSWRIWPSCNVLSENLKNVVFSLDLSIILSLTTPDAKSHLLSDDVVAMNRKLLNEEFGTDVEIVASNGKSVKGHSIFLMLNSEVLKAMLQSELEETRTKKILMDDLCEVGVKAMLSYMYYRDLELLESKCNAAVDVLKAADKYLMRPLEDAVKTLILNKKDMWFNEEAVITLYFHAKNVDRHEDLKVLSVSWLKLKRNQVLSSQMYAEMVKENPMATEEINNILGDNRSKIENSVFDQ